MKINKSIIAPSHIHIAYFVTDIPTPVATRPNTRTRLPALSQQQTRSKVFFLVYDEKSQTKFH